MAPSSHARDQSNTIYIKKNYFNLTIQENMIAINPNSQPQHRNVNIDKPSQDDGRGGV